jgi:hypothetical protein
MLVMEEGGIDRTRIQQTLADAGWDAGEIAAVMANLHVTIDNWEEFDNSSDLRVARESDPWEMAAFRRVKEGSCCGVYEKSIVALRSDGTRSRIRVGFNYGH